MTMSYARVQTEKASEYLVRLSKDWLRTVPEIVFNDRRAFIPFPHARCELEAGEGFLDITLTASTPHYAALLEDFVADHLDSLAAHEHLKYQWTLQ
jgi:hypothetical protein